MTHCFNCDFCKRCLSDDTITCPNTNGLSESETYFESYTSSKKQEGLFWCSECKRFYPEIHDHKETE